MADSKISDLNANTAPASGDLIAIVDDPSGSAETQKITIDNLGLIDGWMPASETWTYASASTITVPSGAASKYTKGDKIKLTQTTVKYFYITAVADTLLTVTGGSNYTVANAAITANYYSHEESPIGFPDYFTYTCTVGAITTAPTISGETKVAKFKISGKKVSICFRLVLGTVSGAGTGSYTFSSPVTLNSNYVSNQTVGACTFYDYSTTTFYNGTMCSYVSNRNVLLVFLGGSTAANWSSTGNPTAIATSDQFFFEASYEMA